MTGTIDKFMVLVTSEHSDKPNFMSTVSLSCQPLADTIDLYTQILNGLNLDNAYGNLLDQIGSRVGASRQLSAPLTGVYFAFDTAAVGFDQGVWFGPYSPTTGLVSLPDDHYRLFIKSKILNNHWDGSKEGAYALLNALFVPFGYQIVIEDLSDLTMRLAITSTNTLPDSLIRAMIADGLFDIRPVGVQITGYFVGSTVGPLFAFDYNTPYLAGFDVGTWASKL